MEIKDALAYLRLLAYKDDLAFMRVANVPKRNIGERRIKFLQEYAAEYQCSLYEALVINLENEIFKGTKAAQFVALIERFAADYAERQISELLSAVLNESGYEKCCGQKAVRNGWIIWRNLNSRFMNMKLLAARKVRWNTTCHMWLCLLITIQLTTVIK